MLVRLSALVERLRSSLFLLPLGLVLVALAAAYGSIVVDRAYSDSGGVPLPFQLTTTVSSARWVLSSIAAATIGFAGVAFSVAMLLFQQAAATYSPRVVHGLFRDPFNRRVIGIVVGNFTYCLATLAALWVPAEVDRAPIIPNLSTATAVVSGLGAVLVVVKFIDHSAHKIDISEILYDITSRTLARIDHRAKRSVDNSTSHDRPTPPDGPGLCVRSAGHGWIQQVDRGELLQLGRLVRLETIEGRYTVAGAPLCTVWPVPPHRSDQERIAERARSAVLYGTTRTMQQDLSYGLRQLVDVALRALSPGVNDPTTAQDAIFHAAAVLSELLRRDIETVIVDDEGRVLWMPESMEHRQLVDLTFDELRLAAAGQPTVCIYLLQAINLIMQSLGEDLSAERAEHLRRQASLVVEGVASTDLPAGDIARVRESYNLHFGTRPTPAAREEAAPEHAKSA